MRLIIKVTIFLQTTKFYGIKYSDISDEMCETMRKTPPTNSKPIKHALTARTKTGARRLRRGMDQELKELAPCQRCAL